MSVLLPAIAPARHGYAIDVVGQVLLARARGRTHRTIGAELGIPADTVRGWIRRVTARAEWLRVQGTTMAHQVDSMLPATVPAGSALASRRRPAQGNRAAGTVVVNTTVALSLS